LEDSLREAEDGYSLFSIQSVGRNTSGSRQRNIRIMAPDDGKMKIAELKEHWLRESIGSERALARREYWLGESMGG
jgi:hypothetical protein